MKIEKRSDKVADKWACELCGNWHCTVCGQVKVYANRFKKLSHECSKCGSDDGTMTMLVHQTQTKQYDHDMAASEMMIRGISPRYPLEKVRNVLDGKFRFVRIDPERSNEAGTYRLESMEMDWIQALRLMNELRNR